MKAMIMAGGEGTRLRPLTCRLPKPMVPLLGKPVMAYTVELLRSHGFDDLTATLMYRPEEIINHFGQALTYFVEKEPMGTAGGVKAAAGQIKDTLLITSGDALTDIDFSQALQFHKSTGAMATLVLKRVENPLEFGVVVTRPDGRIERFLEKPGAGEMLSDTINTGIYLLEPAALEKIPPGNYDFGRDLFPALVGAGEAVYGYIAEGYWCDIGDIDTYRQAHYDALSGKISMIRPEEKGIYIHENARVSTGAVLHAPCWIGPGTVVQSGAKVGPFSVLGERSTLLKNASAVRSILWQGATIGENAEARGALLLDGASLGNASQAYEGAVIGEGSAVGERSVISPGALIWPHKTIENGMKVSGNVVWGGGSTDVLRGRGARGGLHMLPPAECAALGAALASVYADGCAVADHGSGAARMAADAFCAGYSGAGGRVYRLGMASPQSVLYAMDSLQISAGCAARVQGGELLLDLYAAPGTELPVNALRKCRQAFTRREAKPVSIASVPMPVEVRGAFRQRCIHLASRLGIREKLEVAIDARSSDPAIAREIREMLEPYVNMTEYGQRIQATITPDGEGYTLVDEQGKAVESHRIPQIFAWAIGQVEPDAPVIVPADAPGAMEAMAAEAGVGIHRTDATRHAMLEALAEKGSLWHTVYFDGAGALLLLARALALAGQRLCDVLEGLASPNVRKVSFGLREGEKAAAMRHLIEHTRGMDVVMGNGLRLESPYGWALLLPSEDAPEFRVVCEGYSAETADELAGFCIDLLKKREGNHNFPQTAHTKRESNNLPDKEEFR